MLIITIYTIIMCTISLEEWPWTNYPSYFFGPAIVLSQRAILPLFAASQTIPLMLFDDVYYTGICAEKAKIKLHFSSRLFTLVHTQQRDTT